MAENITADFTQSAARAVAASNIAHDWANGGDTTEIPTESGLLPSLRKFMYENVSAAENTRLDLVFMEGETSKSLTSAQFFGNVFFRVSGHTSIVDVVLPSIAKVFYVENLGTSALRVVRGATFETVAMGETILGYTDGTANGLTLILPSEVINNYSAITEPTVNDDTTQGYSVGSRWIDNSEDPIVSYTAISVLEGAADWRQTGITISDLGSMAAQNSTSVDITGGTITGIVDLAIADGGTGASTATTAFNNIKQDASTTYSGVVQGATDAQTLSGTSDRYPDASRIKAHYIPKLESSTYNTSNDVRLTISSFNTFQSQLTQMTGLQVFSTSGDAMMSFHCSRDQAVHFGLDRSTQKLSVGGWSLGANAYEIYHAGNLQLTTPTPAVSTNSTRIATTEFVKESMAPAAAQARSLNTTYTAATAGFFTATVSNGGAVNGGVQLLINGNVRQQSRSTSEGANGLMSVSHYIGAGQTYRATTLSSVSDAGTYWTPIGG
jgi:hypothetical protein